MSDIESSDDELPDIDEYVSMAYKKFTEDNFATEAERPESPVLSLTASGALSALGSQRDNSPKSNRVTDIIRFVKLQCS